MTIEGKTQSVGHIYIGDSMAAKFDEGRKPPPDPHIEAKFWNPRAGTFDTTHKPSKLHKRRHQINSLAHQHQLKAFELANKRGAGHQAKHSAAQRYGW